MIKECFILLILISVSGAVKDVVIIEDSNMKINFYPNTIECNPVGSNGNFYTRCRYSISLEDKLLSDVCLEIEDIYFKTKDGELINLINDYGKKEEYERVCTKYEKVYDKLTDYSPSTCIAYEDVLIKNYIKDNKICNINHKRVIEGYFHDYKKSSDIFSVYFPFSDFKLYFIDPLWFSNNNSFTDGNYFQTFLNETYIQLNISDSFFNGTFTMVNDSSYSSTWKNITWFTEVCYNCELPTGSINEVGDFIRPFNMTGNVFYSRFNNDSLVGENYNSTNASLIYDYSSNGKHGINFRATYTESSKFYGGYTFSGATEYLKYPSANSILPDNSEFSLSVWVKASGWTSYDHILDGYGSAGWMLVQLSGTGDMAVYLASSGGVYDRWEFTGYKPNEWVHYVITYDNGTDYVYGFVDGKNVTMTQAINGKAANVWHYEGSPLFWIGADAGSGSFFNGEIDEVVIWNRTLSNTEIMDLYKRGALRLNLSIRTCDDALCNGESFININSTSPQLEINDTYNLIDNRYFEYNYSFWVNNLNYSPLLFNVTVGYTFTTSTTTTTSTSISGTSTTTLEFPQGSIDIYIFDNKNYFKNRKIFFYQSDNERYIKKTNFSQKVSLGNNISYEGLISPSEYDIITNPESGQWLRYAVLVLIPILGLISFYLIIKK